MAEKKTTAVEAEATVDKKESAAAKAADTKQETVDVDAFIARKLKALNHVENKARAQRDAARVLANRKGNK